MIEFPTLKSALRFHCVNEMALVKAGFIDGAFGRDVKNIPRRQIVKNGVMLSLVVVACDEEFSRISREKCDSANADKIGFESECLARTFLNQSQSISGAPANMVGAYETEENRTIWKRLRRCQMLQVRAGGGI